MDKWLITILMLMVGSAAMAQNVITAANLGAFTITISEDDAGKTFMRYDGGFVPASGGAITNYLRGFPDIEYLEFNSPGGSLLEINGPGALLRETGITFVVREGDVCVSACAFLALYSKNIELEGLIAFHLPYRPGYSRASTLYDISQSMVERTLRQTRQMFDNDWLIYLYLTIARESDMTNFLVFNDIAELNKFRMTDKSQFMNAPEVNANVVIMDSADLSEYMSTYTE